MVERYRRLFEPESVLWETARLRGVSKRRCARYSHIERLHGTADQPPSGHSGPSHFAGSPVWRNAWARDCPPHRANDRRDISGQSGLALPGPAPYGGQRLVEIVM